MRLQVLCKPADTYHAACILQDCHKQRLPYHTKMMLGPKDAIRIVPYFTLPQSWHHKNTIDFFRKICLTMIVI